MKIAALLTLLVALTAGAHAGWQIESSQRLPAPGIVQVRKEFVSTDGAERATAHFVFFNAQTHSIRIFDDPNSGLGVVMSSNKCIAGTNGGYFHPDYTPLGLLVSGGRQIHALERARLLSGLIVATDRRLRLLRTAEFDRKTQPRDALQAGPFLVDGGRPVAGLNNTARARRTVIMTNGSDRWALGIVQSPTLAEAAALLATPGAFGEMKIMRALNLDGGSSTAFWVDGSPPYYLRGMKQVRNFIGVVLR